MEVQGKFYYTLKEKNQGRQAVKPQQLLGGGKWRKKGKMPRLLKLEWSSDRK